MNYGAISQNVYRFFESGCSVVSEGFYLVFFNTDLNPKKREELLKNSGHDIHSQNLRAFLWSASQSHRNVGQDTKEKV